MAIALQISDVPSQEFSVDDFTASLLAGVAAKGKTRIPIGHPRVENGFKEIVDLLRQSALTAEKNGRSDFAFRILEVLEELRPDPNSGLFEGFWSSLRRQQPGRASVPNPSYNFLQLRLPPHDAKAYLARLPNEWQTIVDEAVKRLMKGL